MRVRKVNIEMTVTTVEERIHLSDNKHDEIKNNISKSKSD
jgi:hypothetical protein